MARREDDFDAEEGGLPAFLSDPVGVLRRRGIWMAAMQVLAAAAVVLGVWLLVPVTYLGTATILVRDQQIPGEFVRPSVTDSPLATLDALLGQALSRQHLSQLIEEHDLYAEARSRASMLELTERMRKDIEVAPAARMNNPGPSEASVYTISFRYAEAAASADIANALASKFVAVHATMRGQQARLTTEFLRSELERSERELRAQDAEIARFKEAHRGELPNEFAGTSAKLERLNSARQTLVMQITSAESRLGILAQGGSNPSLDSPYARLAALRAALAKEAAVNTDEHPNVISLRQQIAVLERQMESSDSAGLSADAMVDASQKELVALRNQLAEVESEAKRLEQQISLTPQREEQMAALTQRAEVLRETYLANLRKVKAAELSESLESAQQGARVQVLDRAEPPSKPDSKRLRLLLVGLAGSVFAALAVGVVLEVLDPVIVSAKELEDALGVPLLGSVGRIG
jgi:uncharacterized protein involved in exopolysaccharide biosynthesis